ncbi:diacylglycerol kinase family lipid kinase [Dactylosporangium roseum]|uniref:Diacylglycerol kinase family lipid kinase n=1 Tax=Dactylosporangium roseum TaxID=47989 RepID=A0ABY5Z898_9ACTN|nr:diacylglycerol kinase family protein [Dactylosporangium roseum]UWZ37687.1 diacylglycerol kinase family lipid kinase [Dactylosporangium roseum]
MRALLVVNPNATTTTERGRDILVRALRSQVDLDVAYTQRRGHAADLAREAAREGLDLVVTLGGDGTVNEAVNGLMTFDSGPAPDRAQERPALAVVPGGSTNVFARALGLPSDWAEGTGAILEALRDRRERIIGLGRADDRYFTFCAGMGIDAEVVRRVDQARRKGSTSTPWLYFRATMAQFAATNRRMPLLTLELPGEPAQSGITWMLVQNTAPWTYIGERPVDPNPRASFDTGLDVLGLRELQVASTARTVTQILSNRHEPKGKQVVRMHDLSGFTLTAAKPIAFQVDGEYLGECDKLDFASVPGALRVVC